MYLIEVNDPRISVFTVDFEFDEIEIINQRELIIVFSKEKNAKNIEFVAKVYDFFGNHKFNINFPEVEIFNEVISLLYIWFWNVEDGLRIVFNTDSRIIDDFWYEFNFQSKTYVQHGKAY